jgi:hypothetical protein
MSPEYNALTPDEIAFCAYFIWEKEGRPLDRAREHWLQAETQLLACHAYDESTDTPRFPLWGLGMKLRRWLVWPGR